MKVDPYVEKLNSSQEFKEFKEKNPDSYLAAGFFIIDLENENNIHQIDYYIPSSKKIAAFTLDEEIKVQVLDTLNEKVPEKLDLKINTDLEALKGILEDEMKNRNMSQSIKKLIAVIQTIEGKDTWTINCVLSGMEILRASIEDESKTVLKMEKSSIMEFVKKVPVQQLKPKPSPESKEQIKQELSKLNELADEIKKEKSELESELKDLEENKDKK